MSNGADGPLSEAHLAQLKAGMEAADEALRQIEMAKRAGIDMGAQEAETRALRDRLAQIRQVYFPGR
jgi:hypothetical protein